MASSRASVSHLHFLSGAAALSPDITRRHLPHAGGEDVSSRWRLWEPKRLGSSRVPSGRTVVGRAALNAGQRHLGSVIQSLQATDLRARGFRQVASLAKIEEVTEGEGNLCPI